VAASLSDQKNISINSFIIVSIVVVVCLLIFVLWLRKRNQSRRGKRKQNKVLAYVNDGYEESTTEKHIYEDPDLVFESIYETPVISHTTRLNPILENSLYEA